MLTITQPKLAGLTPRWAPFAGYSLLLDNPGRSLRREAGIETVACDVVGDPGLGFYRRLHEGFAGLDPDRLLQTYGLCPLPPASYHVTAYDVANVGDLGACRADALDGLRDLLADLPLDDERPILAPARTSPLATGRWRLRFAYDALGSMGGHGVLVRLRPADDASAAELARFTEARAALSRTMQERFGIGAGERYTPHVSLGYFANPQGSELAADRLERWDAALRAAVGDEVLELTTASLYAFTDMASFRRRA